MARKPRPRRRDKSRPSAEAVGRVIGLARELVEARAVEWLELYGEWTDAPPPTTFTLRDLARSPGAPAYGVLRVWLAWLVKDGVLRRVGWGVYEFPPQSGLNNSQPPRASDGSR